MADVLSSSVGSSVSGYDDPRISHLIYLNHLQLPEFFYDQDTSMPVPAAQFPFVNPHNQTYFLMTLQGLGDRYLQVNANPAPFPNVDDNLYLTKEDDLNMIDVYFNSALSKYIPSRAQFGTADLQYDRFTGLGRGLPQRDSSLEDVTQLFYGVNKIDYGFDPARYFLDRLQKKYPEIDCTYVLGIILPQGKTGIPYTNFAQWMGFLVSRDIAALKTYSLMGTFLKEVGLSLLSQNPDDETKIRYYLALGACNIPWTDEQRDDFYSALDRLWAHQTTREDTKQVIETFAKNGWIELEKKENVIYGMSKQSRQRIAKEVKTLVQEWIHTDTIPLIQTDTIINKIKAYNFPPDEVIEIPVKEFWQGAYDDDSKINVLRLTQLCVKMREYVRCELIDFYTPDVIKGIFYFTYGRFTHPSYMESLFLEHRDSIPVQDIPFEDMISVLNASWLFDDLVFMDQTDFLGWLLDSYPGHEEEILGTYCHYRAEAVPQHDKPGYNIPESWDMIVEALHRPELSYAQITKKPVTFFLADDVTSYPRCIKMALQGELPSFSLMPSPVPKFLRLTPEFFELVYAARCSDEEMIQEAVSKINDRYLLPYGYGCVLSSIEGLKGHYDVVLVKITGLETVEVPFIGKVTYHTVQKVGKADPSFSNRLVVKPHVSPVSYFNLKRSNPNRETFSGPVIDQDYISAKARNLVIWITQNRSTAAAFSLSPNLTIEQVYPFLFSAMVNHELAHLIDHQAKADAHQIHHTVIPEADDELLSYLYAVAQSKNTKLILLEYWGQVWKMGNEGKFEFLPHPDGYAAQTAHGKGASIFFIMMARSEGLITEEDTLLRFYEREGEEKFNQVMTQLIQAIDACSDAKIRQLAEAYQKACLEDTINHPFNI